MFGGLHTEHGLLGWSDVLLNKVVQNLLQPDGRELGVVAPGLGGFEGSADVFLQFCRDSARQGGHNNVHLGIGEFGIVKGVDEVFECRVHDGLVVKSIEDFVQTTSPVRS